MIVNFKHKGLKNFFENGSKKGIQAKHVNKLEAILAVLDSAETIEQIACFKNLNLHILEPKKNNVYAVKVSGNWRVTFRFENGNCYIVNYLDYH